jgi:hypothetical protein
MASNLVDQLRALARSPGSYYQSGLPPLAYTLRVDTQVGKGTKVTETVSVVSPSVRQEVCVVYSEVLVTEAGVFEMPLNWPDENTYTESFDEALLPELGAAYVKQRRTHGYVLDDGSAFHLIACYAKPFSYAGEAVVFPPPSGRFRPVMQTLRAAFSGDALETAVSTLLAVYGI